MGLMRQTERKTEPPQPERIEELFAALESPLMSYALRLVRNTATAEDIVQEAFMRLHKQFNEVREPRHWLYRTVHNLALNDQRRGANVISWPEEPSGQNTTVACEYADPQPLPDEQIARMEGIGLVRLCLETLDARSRELVHLKFDEDLSYKEISERTGLNIGHVGYLLHHALKSLADELTRNGGV